MIKDINFSRSASRPTKRPELEPRANNCLACEYTEFTIFGVALCLGVGGRSAWRGVRGVTAFAPTCTRCLGVTGDCGKSSRNRDFEGVLNSNSIGFVISSACPISGASGATPKNFELTFHRFRDGEMRIDLDRRFELVIAQGMFRRNILRRCLALAIFLVRLFDSFLYS